MQKEELTRREFIRLTSTGFAASAVGGTAFDSLIDARSNLPPEDMPVGATMVSLRNGSSTLDLRPGPAGYGISLCTLINGKMERVADTPCPVRMFYGIRTPESLVNVAFHYAHKTWGGMRAGAEFSDKQSNRWEVTFQATRAANGGFECSFDYRLSHGAAEDVFFEHSLTPDLPASGEETYILMPGLLYDGNRLTEPGPKKAIPQLAAAQDFQVDTPIFTLSIPVTAYYERRTGKTLIVLTKPSTALDMSGFSCVNREDDHRISVMAPCYREKHFHHDHYTPETPKGATISEGMRFRVPATYFALTCPDITGLFEALQPIRELVRGEFKRANRLPLSEAAALVENNFNTRMWADGAENQFYINAMNPAYDLAKSGVAGLYPGWQLQVGWCAGVITGYALLNLGEELSCQRSRTMLDRIASGGLSPSGLFWSIYGNGKWDPVRNNNLGLQHMRMPADGTFYYLKAIALERGRGLEHPNWEKAAISNLDAFTRLWTEHQDFGHKVDRNTLAIVVPGTAAGALCIGGLALGANLPRGKEYLAVAHEASKAFYERFVQTGWIVAGPLDIPNAPDSESVTALLESYVTMYEVTKDRLYLQYAQDTARHLATWVVAYNATFPEGTFCQQVGVQTIGGVLANSQNHHIGPSFCTNSGGALLRLYRYTGDTLPLHLLEDVISGLPQFVFSGKEPDRNMKPGMVSEQFNMSDELGTRGAMGEVCASWPATCVLLSYGEVPSVFVDLNSGRCAVFDQIEASFKAKSQSLHLSNPTVNAARIRVQRSQGQDLNLVLAAGQSKVIPLARVFLPVFMILVLGLTFGFANLASGQGSIHQDTERKLVTLSDGQRQLELRLNYDGRCILDQVNVRGREVVSESGVCTGIRRDGQWFTTRNIATPVVTVNEDTLTVKGITFGGPGTEIHETWRFVVQSNAIVWRITRKYPAEVTLEDAALPEWDFSSMSTWTGGILDNGGVVWNKYLDKTNATYGAHFGMVTFWNSQADDCLRITPDLPPNQSGAGLFSCQSNGVFSFNYVINGEELIPKHKLRRFLENQQDLWSPFHVKPTEVSAQFTLKALDYASTYNRGTFSGINGNQVRDLLNTVARYGVIDERLTGGNGWRTGWICLHEPFFAEIGLALDESDYIANFSKCLDFERDHAVGADGRVKGRWRDRNIAGNGSDADCFYEPGCGWLLDSQPDYVMNVAEQFNLTGDRHWLAGQKAVCEKALNYLMRREVSHSGLVAMLDDSIMQQKSSDWIDAIWAAHENAFVNAELYYALNLWAGAEDTLGDPAHAAAYRDFATRLKTSFNRPIADGGFWDPTNQWYVYWRDQDGSIHGDNLVTPVNFMAIAYGICDDPARQKAILDRMENEMQKEGLFSWPLCFYPFQPEEGAKLNFPFPRYENGDLFLSWNELGVRAYAAYDPAIALKYVRNVLARYGEDGLSYQRYLRKTQRGSGADILAGNCMTMVGLYRDIYGIQPQPNRLYLEPHLPRDLNGTQLRYELRGQLYLVDLNTESSAITVAGCTFRDSHPFGVNASGNGLEYFPGTNSDWAMSVSRSNGQPLTVQIKSWPGDPDSPREWTETSPQAKGETFHQVTNLRAGTIYELKINGQLDASLRADKTGDVRFNYNRGYATPPKFELGLADQAQNARHLEGTGDHRFN